MAKQSQRKSGGMRKYGRSLDKCAHYKAMHTREKNKIRRILRSNGSAEAQKYAIQNNLVNYLSKLRVS